MSPTNARIDAAREKGAERDVRDHVRFDGIGQHRFERPCRFVARAAEWFRIANLPVLPDVDAPVTISEVVARRQLVHALEDGPVARRIEVRQVVIERPEVDIAGDRARCYQRLDLGPEEQPAAGQRVVQRLLPGAIPSQQERTRTAIPQADAEHAAQLRECRFAPFLVGVDDRFGVA